MKKFFRAFCEDGSAEYLSEGEAGPVGLKIRTDGLMYFGCSIDRVSHGPGAIFAGDSVFVSTFINGIPDGESLLVKEGALHRITFSSAFIQTDEILYGDVAGDFYESYMQKHSLFETVRRCELFDTTPQLHWEEVVGRENLIENVSNLIDIDLVPNLIGYIGSEQVLLTRLPPQPPSGMIEITGGIQIKAIDVWTRKLNKVSSHSFERATTIKGFYNHYDAVYIVSSLPPTVEEFRLVTANNSHDCVVDAICEIVKIVDWLRSMGVAWNGLLNRRCFITTSEGVIYLNTAYLLSRFPEHAKMFGGFSSEELRFMSPSQIVRCSTSARVILESLGFRIPSPESICSGETRNLGLLIYSLVMGDSIVPMHWLSDAQFALANWLSFVAPDEPVGRCLSISCHEPVDIIHPENVRLLDSNEMEPLIRIANRLYVGTMNLDELNESIQSYIKWRDTQIAESSVETEVKAVFGRMSAFIQSGQDAMKSAISKSLDNSW